MFRFAVLAVVGGLVYGAVVVLVGSDDDGSTAVTTAPTSTAEVVVTDLVLTDSYDATLDFASTRAVVNRLAGTVTWTNTAGAIVGQGQSFYSVDGVPVVLFVGEVPAYRELSTDSDNGADIRQLEENLVALGYATTEDLTIDEEFDADTEAAVELWEESLAVEADGIVQLGQVVFLPEPVRIDAVSVDIGGNASDGAEVVSVTSPAQEITFTLDASIASDAVVGDVVTIGLPDGTETTATVTAVVPSVASSDTAATAETEAEETTETVDVTLIPDDPATVSAWDTATIDVQLVSDSAPDALAVPVTALVALAEGGYAVKVVDAAAPEGWRYVPVDPGLYADDLVEISGAALQPGAQVVVPA